MLFMPIFLASKINTKEKRDLKYCLSWDEFYREISPQGVQFESGKKTNPLTLQSSYYIVFCSFAGFEQTSIVFDTQTSENKVLLEDCLFKSNQNDGNSDGGSFKFAEEGDCVQNRICCHSSYIPSLQDSEYKGVYCYVDTTSNAKNWILESSVIKSGHGYIPFRGRDTIFLTSGSKKMDNVNIYIYISSSEVYSHCIYGFEEVNYECKVSYCSFINNNGDFYGHACSQYGFSNSKVNITHCNYLKNKVNNGLIATFGPSLLIKDCCIIDNCKPGYKTFNCPIGFNPELKTRSITINHCYVDQYTFNTPYEITLEIQNNITDPFTNELSHFNSAECLIQKTCCLRFVSIVKHNSIDKYRIVGMIGYSFFSS